MKSTWMLHMFENFELPTNKGIRKYLDIGKNWNMSDMNIGTISITNINNEYKGAIIEPLNTNLKNNTICFLDIDRFNMSENDNHTSGPHSNLLIIKDEEIIRYEPYYASTINDTNNMQYCIDKTVDRLIGKSTKQCKCGWFGPQIITDTADKKTEAEAYCLYWCSMVAEYVSKYDLPFENAYNQMMKEYNLRIPTSEKEAKLYSNEYLQVIRNYAHSKNFAK